MVFLNSHVCYSSCVTIEYRQEVGKMRNAKHYLLVSSEEARVIITSLLRLRNRLLQQGRYTDCVDELILKISAE